MKRPVRTTVVFGLISALAVIPSAWLFSGLLGGPMAFHLTLWIDLFIYAILLARWSGKPMTAILFPLVLLMAAALWPDLSSGFLFLALGVFSWIRSGVCFTDSPVRAMVAEVTTVAGGMGLLALLSPHSTVTWGISIWLFFLVQSLYFFFIPGVNPSHSSQSMEDPFERARQEAVQMIEKCDLG